MTTSTHLPQPSLIALLRSAVDQLQQYRPYLQRNKSAAKGYIAVMQKCSEPEEGGEYGYLHKGFVMRAIEDACRDARPQSRPEAELPELCTHCDGAGGFRRAVCCGNGTPLGDCCGNPGEEFEPCGQCGGSGQQCAATRPGNEFAPEWTDGLPPTWWEEWFIASLDNGDRVVLKPLPEEYTYDFTTADGTYFMKSRVRRWMQFPDTEFKTPAEIRATRPAEVGGDGVDAARWRAVIGCARIRLLGSAGLHSENDPYGKPHGNYGHIGLELWTVHDAGSYPEAVADFTRFADKAVAAMKERTPPSPGSEVRP